MMSAVRPLIGEAELRNRCMRYVVSFRKVTGESEVLLGNVKWQRWSQERQTYIELNFIRPVLTLYIDHRFSTGQGGIQKSLKRMREYVVNFVRRWLQVVENRRIVKKSNYRSHPEAVER
jgi:hypothetical protein